MLLLQDFTYLILLLSIIGVLGFSAGVNYCNQRCVKEAEVAEHRESSRGLMQRGKKEALNMNTNKDDTGVEEMKMKRSEKKQVKREKREPIKEENGKREPMSEQDSSWVVQDSNPAGPACDDQQVKSVQRKPSLTGEEVKVLADDLIARVRQRMRAQRQDSLKLKDKSRPETPFEAPPLP